MKGTHARCSHMKSTDPVVLFVHLKSGDFVPVTYCNRAHASKVIRSWWDALVAVGLHEAPPEVRAALGQSPPEPEAVMRARYILEHGVYAHNLFHADGEGDDSLATASFLWSEVVGFSTRDVVTQPPRVEGDEWKDR